MTEISLTASLERNAKYVLDLISELERHHYDAMPPDVYDIVQQIKWATEEIKNEANRADKSQKIRTGNRYPDRQ
jgi:hypothetical protein